MTIVNTLKKFANNIHFDSMIENISIKCVLVEDNHKDKFDKYFEHLNIIYDEKLEDSIAEDANISKSKNKIGRI